VKKLTDEGFPVGLADLLTYTDKESMEKSLQQTQEVFKSALEAAVKERLRGKTPAGIGMLVSRFQTLCGNGIRRPGSKGIVGDQFYRSATSYVGNL